MVEPQKWEVMNQGGLECGFWTVWGERARATTSLEQEAFVLSSQPPLFSTSPFYLILFQQEFCTPIELFSLLLANCLNGFPQQWTEVCVLARDCLGIILIYMNPKKLALLHRSSPKPSFLYLPCLLQSLALKMAPPSFLVLRPQALESSLPPLFLLFPHLTVIKPCWL